MPKTSIIEADIFDCSNEAEAVAKIVALVQASYDCMPRTQAGRERGAQAVWEVESFDGLHSYTLTGHLRGVRIDLANLGWGADLELLLTKHSADHIGYRAGDTMSEGLLNIRKVRLV